MKLATYLALTITIAFAFERPDSLRLYAQNFTGDDALVTDLVRLEELHHRVFTATDWQELKDASTEYAPLVVKLKSLSNEVVNKWETIDILHDDQIAIQYLRSLQILDISPTDKLMGSLRLAIRQQDSQVAADAIGYLFNSGTRVTSADVINALTHQDTQVSLRGVSLYSRSDKSSEVEERLADLLKNPIPFTEFVGANATIISDGRAILIEDLSRYRVAHEKVRIECKRISSSNEATRLRHAANHYLRVLYGEQDSNVSLMLEAPIPFETVENFYLWASSGLRSRAISGDDVRAIERLWEYKSIKPQAIRLLRLIEDQEAISSQRLLENIIDSSNSSELYVLARTLEYVYFSTENIERLSEKICQTEDVNGLLASRAALIAMTRSRHRIPANTLLDFKDQLAHHALLPPVRQLLNSIDNPSIFFIRHSLADSRVLKDW